jgi:hypothetical protein
MPVESDIRYYSRRACEEMAAANRAVTEAARDRRLQLVDLYLDHLKSLNAPSPFEERQFPRAPVISGVNGHRSAFAWPEAVRESRI